MSSGYALVARLIAGRLLRGIVTLFAVSIVIFSAVAFLPGDFATSILGMEATPETVAAFRTELGLDEPVVVRYLQWIGAVLTGDFGNSFSSSGSFAEQRAVVDIVGPRLYNTSLLAGLSALISVPVALFLGVVAAIWRNSILDRMINLISLGIVAVPEFAIAYTLIFFFAVTYPVFPSLAAIDPRGSWADTLITLALPSFTLSVILIAHMMRMTRSAIVSVLSTPYIEMAHLKGIPPVTLVLRHALPNVWGPIITVVAFSLAYLVVGVVVVESVFSYTGIGRTMVEAVRARDMPVVQACTLIFAGTYILLNLLADVISVASNPKLLYPR